MYSTRERIIQAAIDVFFHKGFDAASMREISEKAGVTKPMIYYHFKNKEALYCHLLEEHLAVFCRNLETLLAADRAYIDLFYAVIDLYESTFSQSEKIYHLIQREISGNGRLVGFLTEKYFSRIFLCLAQFIQKGVAIGAINPLLDSRLAGLTLSSILLFYFSQRNVLTRLSCYADPEIFSGDALRSHILNLFLCATTINGEEQQ